MGDSPMPRDHDHDHEHEHDTSADEPMLRVLGAPRLSFADGTTKSLTGTGALLLARLVSASGDVVSTDRLLEDVWMGHVGEGTVRTAISRLRSALGPHRDAISQSGVGYRFDGSYLATDVIRLERLLRTALAADARPTVSRSALAAALHQSSGRLFDGHEASFLDRDRDSFLQLRLRVIEQLAGLPDHLDADDLDEVVRQAEEHPERETLVVIAARGLGHAGRRPNALRLCARHRKVVWENWGVVPSEAFDQVEHALLGDSSDDGPTASSPDAIAVRRSISRLIIGANSGLVGRDGEQRAIERLLTSRRVVSIVGFGGVGKTHLALEVGRASPADRAVFIDFTHALSEDGVEATILDAFGLGQGEIAAPVETKISTVIDAPTLVILDNCEQVEHRVRSFIERLVSSTPDVTVLTTSRSPIGVTGEFVFPLASLTTRADRPESAGAASPAFAMLRALVDHVDWEVESEPGEQLVEAVGGLPLAVVFLARMLHSVSPSELLATIGDAESIQAMDDGIAVEIRRVADRALERLDPDTQRLFTTLSCIPGRFDLALATAISPSHEQGTAVASRLQTLVEVGFVERHPGGSGLRLTALLQSYAAAAIEGDEHRRATAAMWRHLAEVALIEERHTRGVDQLRGLRVLEGHWPLVNELLTTEIPPGHLDDACMVASRLGSFWFLSGRWAEGPTVIRRLLDDPRLVDARHRGRLVAALAECSGTYAATAALLPLLRDTIDALDPIAVDERDFEALATCHTYATSSSIWLGDVAGFERHLAGARRLIDEFGFAHLAGLITMFLGLRLRNDDRAEMRRMLHQARAHYLALGDRGRAANVMLNLGMVLARYGELQVAESTFRDCLDLANGLAMQSLEAHAGSQLAQIAARKGASGAADDLRAARIAFVALGDIGCLSSCNRQLAALASSVGDDDDALRWLRDSLDVLATVDQQEFALTLVEIAEIYTGQGRTADAAVIVAVARANASGVGVGISEEQRQRMDDLAQVLDTVPPDRELAIALAAA